MSDPLLIVAFLAAGALSLFSSWTLIARIERVGARLGLSESLLGMLAALGGDAPEITAAISALAGHESHIGAGVVLGSNVFNLAALLGLAAIAAGRIALHRRVIEMNGAVAVWLAGAALLVATAVIPPVAGLLIATAVLAPYLAVLGMRRRALMHVRLPDGWARWLRQAIAEEEAELEAAIHPPRARARDAVAALAAAVVVVGASIAMERTASKLGARHGVPEILTGAVVLAAVTSLPNAVAAIYLAARGRGAAVLSTALNSNALNVVAGLLLPGTIIGLGAASGERTFLAAGYAVMTALTLALAYLDRGLRRSHGAVVVAFYAAFVAVLVAVVS
jgi:cation:H+ antiporter